MQLKPFLLDAWLDQNEHDIEFNLAASTGPTWTVNDILTLADDETRHRFLNHKLVYGRPAGATGDCFDTPSHFRLGFAAAGDNLSKALDSFGAFAKSWSAKMVTA